MTAIIELPSNPTENLSAITFRHPYKLAIGYLPSVNLICFPYGGRTHTGGLLSNFYDLHSRKSP